MSVRPAYEAPRAVGRYLLFDEIASGGMATVHWGRLVGPGGFSRTVAIKRLYAQFARDPGFVSKFLDEARLAARIRHPHVVSTLDVVAEDGEVFVVMDYVHGESLARLFEAMRQADSAMPWPLACFAVAQALIGLHAAHEATTESGEPLHVIHRDVSPHNLLVGSDGVVRVADFGVAKAAARVGTTPDGNMKGKLGYMAPEQLREGPIDRRVDVFSASIVLYEALTGRRLFAADDAAATLANILMSEIEPPSRLVPEIPADVDKLVLKGLERDVERRFGTAHEMARELQARVPMPSVIELGEWVQSISGEMLERRRRMLNRIESQSSDVLSPPFAGTDPAPSITPQAYEVASNADRESSLMQPVAGTRRRGGRWVAVVVATVAALAFLVWGAFAGKSSGQNASSSLNSVAKPSAIAKTASKPPLELPKEPARPPVVVERPKPTEPEAENDPPQRPIVKRPPRRAPFATKAVKVSKTGEPPAGCDPPYAFNHDGSKRFKLECF